MIAHLGVDLARIRAFSSTLDVLNLTPPQYGRSPLLGAYRPFYILARWMVPAYLALWEADARPVPFEVLNDVRRRCELLH